MYSEIISKLEPVVKIYNSYTKNVKLKLFKSALGTIYSSLYVTLLIGIYKVKKIIILPVLVAIG